ncbi:hypothetical protein BDZ45DRAFT_505425 [Acephala macrosclerotiorum]|nr:hypothetical protein BDZ45DRAFT_505425 [Acephala macrosclerotiorum]
MFFYLSLLRKQRWSVPTSLSFVFLSTIPRLQAQIHQRHRVGSRRCRDSLFEGVHLRLTILSKSIRPITPRLTMQMQLQSEQLLSLPRKDVILDYIMQSTVCDDHRDWVAQGHLTLCASHAARVPMESLTKPCYRRDDRDQFGWTPKSTIAALAYEWRRRNRQRTASKARHCTAQDLGTCVHNKPTLSPRAFFRNLRPILLHRTSQPPLQSKVKYSITCLIHRGLTASTLLALPAIFIST